jgi:Plasmid pRiA4b ORF-3-like protein
MDARKEPKAMSVAERVARIKISLAEIEPVIWRLVEVPVGMRLKALHDVIQASFGWWNYHLYEFEAGDRRYGIPDPDLVFDREVRSARNVKLEALIARGHTRMVYTYDFGDGWRHDVAIEAVEEGVPGVLYPRLVAGERRGPPEDVGGPYGYFEFLEAILDPSHEDHARMIEWCGGRFDPGEADLAIRASLVERLAARRRSGMEGYEKSRRVRAGESR